MADVSVNIYQSITNRDGVSTPVSGVINGDPLPNPLNPPTGQPFGIGIKLNGQVRGGVKRLIETSDKLDIPLYWQYNVTGLNIDGTVDNDGEINFI